MHELSICQGLLRSVERIATDNGATAVDRIVLSVGALAGVEAPLLQRAFSVARLSTIAAQAQLEIRSGPVRVHCRYCGKDSRVEAYRLLCHHCESWQVNVIAGEELLLLQVELSGLPASPKNGNSGQPVNPGP